MPDDFLKYTKNRIKKLKAMNRKRPDKDRDLVIQQLEYLVETYEAT